MGFLQLLPTLMQLVSSHVLGGLGVILFGFIAANGLKILIDEKIDLLLIRNVFIISIMIIIGLGGTIVGFNTHNVSVTFSGTSIAMVCGMTCNLFLPHDRGIDYKKMPKAKKRKKAT